MAQQIMIDIADDGATSVTVQTDAEEAMMMDFATAEEALAAVSEMIAGEAPSEEQMWDEEAANRDQEMMMMEEMA